MMRSRYYLPVRCIFAFLTLASLCQATVQITFTKIADTATQRPEGGTFTSFPVVSIDDSNVAFMNFIDNWNAGIYLWDNGTIEPIAIGNATTGTIIPGAPYLWKGDHWEPRRFVRFGGPTINGGVVAFQGSNPYSIESGGWSGIYTWDNGSINEVADMDTQIPGSTQTFGVNGFSTNFNCGLSDNSGGTVVFAGCSSSEPWSGIYTNEGGSLRVVADCNTPVPGRTGNFGNVFRYDYVSIDGSCIAFGLASYSGIYAEDDYILHVVANSNTEVPGFPGEHFSGLYRTCVDRGDIAFDGGATFYDGFNYGGIFAVIDGQLHTLVNNRWNMPWGRFPAFTVFSFKNRKLVFWTWGALYTNIGGSFIKVIGDGDMLDGKTLLSSYGFYFFRDGFSGNQIAFRADFTDGSSGIYVATLVVTSISGDLNSDGIVDFADFAIMAAQWQQQDPHLFHQQSADIAEPSDYVVNQLDLSVLAQHWLEGVGQ